MSYLHCPSCRCAYNLAQQPACPRCGVQAGAPVDPTQDVIVAAEQLARAMARATPAQIADADAVLEHRADQLALPAPGHVAGAPPELLDAVRRVLIREHRPEPDPRPEPALLALIFDAIRASSRRPIALLATITAPRPTGLRAWARAQLAVPVARARQLFARA